MKALAQRLHCASGCRGGWRCRALPDSGVICLMVYLVTGSIFVIGRGNAGAKGKRHSALASGWQGAWGFGRPCTNSMTSLVGHGDLSLEVAQWRTGLFSTPHPQPECGRRYGANGSSK